MTLGREVGLGPRHVSDGDPGPSKGAQPPNFGATSIVAKWYMDGLWCHLVWR